MSRFIGLALLACRLWAGASADPLLAGLEGALAANNLSEAHAWQQRLLLADENVDALLAAGALLAQHDMLPDAAAVFEKCSQRFPGSFEAKYNLTLARIALNDYAAAEASLRAVSPSSPRETSAVQYLQGKIYAAEGRPGEARQSFESAYRGNPDEENYALDLALAYIRSSAYVPAIQVLEQSTARHAGSEELALELALSNALAGRATDALANCHKLLENDPRLATARVIAAFANCLAAHYQACESEASAGLALPGSNPYLHYLYAEALWNTNAPDRPKIQRELDAAIAQIPRCGVCFLLRSKVFEASQDNRAAVADLRSALQIDATSAQAWYRLSALYRKIGQAAEAADAARHYRAIKDQQTNQEIESFRKQLLTSLDKQSNP